MRGKVLELSSSEKSVRITPAYAGKSAPFLLHVPPG